jgi:hypothetical protein
VAAGCEQQPSLLPELEDSDTATRADSTAAASPSPGITIEVDTAWAGEHHVYY